MDVEASRVDRGVLAERAITGYAEKPRPAAEDRPMAPSAPVQWAPRVSRATIRRLYENDARGIVDEELIDEVAFGFHARCESVINATEAARGRAACPHCERTIEHDHEPRRVLRCEPCKWEATWLEYRRSYRRRQLITQAPAPYGPFGEYVRRLSAARSRRAKMLLIDWLIQQLHNWRPEGGPPVLGRSVAVNLIEGSASRVLEFLDELFTGPESSEESRRAHGRWRGRVFHQEPDQSPRSRRGAGAPPRST